MNRAVENDYTDENNKRQDKVKKAIEKCQLDLQSCGQRNYGIARQHFKRNGRI